MYQRYSKHHINWGDDIYYPDPDPKFKFNLRNIDFQFWAAKSNFFLTLLSRTASTSRPLFSPLTRMEWSSFLPRMCSSPLPSTKWVFSLPRIVCLSSLPRMSSMEWGVNLDERKVTNIMMVSSLNYLCPTQLFPFQRRACPPAIIKSPTFHFLSLLYIAPPSLAGLIQRILSFDQFCFFEGTSSTSFDHSSLLALIHSNTEQSLPFKPPSTFQTENFWPILI